MRVLVLHDAVPAGAAPDALDTLVQVEAVAGALTALGARCSVRTVPEPLDGLAGAVRRERAGLVFNLVESYRGQGRYAHLPALLLEAEGVPMTGAGATALSTTSNKPLAKQVMRSESIPTPPWVNADDQRGLDEVGGGPWIVKSVWEHASAGLGPDSVVDSLEEADELASRLGRRLGGQWFAERYVEGRELSVAMIERDEGPVVLGLSEVRFDGVPLDEPRIVGYDAKWDPASEAYARTEPVWLREGADPLEPLLRDIATRCWRVFAMTGYARVDLRIDRNGRPWVLEVNANPCLAPDAGLARAAAHAGIDYRDLVGLIARAATDRFAAAA